MALLRSTDDSFMIPFTFPCGLTNLVKETSLGVVLVIHDVTRSAAIKIMQTRDGHVLLDHVV